MKSVRKWTKSSDPFQNGVRLRLGWFSGDHTQAIKF